MHTLFCINMLAQTGAIEIGGLTVGGAVLALLGQQGIKIIFGGGSKCPLHDDLVAQISEIKRDTRMIVHHLMGNKETE